MNADDLALIEAQDRANDAESRLADVEMLHQPAGGLSLVWCIADGRTWPCPTTIALRGEA